MDYYKLKNLLGTAEYDGLSDADAALLANQKRHPAARERRATYLSVARDVGPETARRLIATLDAVAESDPLVAEIRHRLRSSDGVDVSHSTTAAMLDLFAAHPDLPLTSEDAASIQELADYLESDAERIGCGYIGEQHVLRARMED